jgi:hypothetical protein
LKDKRLRKPHPIESFKNWYKPRNRKAVGAFILSLLVSVIFLGFAVHYIFLPRSYQPIDYNNFMKMVTLNPNADPTSQSETQSALAQFEIPLSYRNWTLPMELNLTLISNYFFVADTLTYLNASIYTIGNSSLANAVDIETIELNIDNAVTVYPDDNSFLIGYSSGYSTPNYFENKTVFFHETNPSLYTAFNQTWFSIPYNYALFRDSGAIKATIVVEMHPSSNMSSAIYSYLEQVDQNYGYNYQVTLTIPNIHIKLESELTAEQRGQQLQAIQLQEMNVQSQLQAVQALTMVQSQQQQNDTNNTNMGLTFVVLFLTSVQIGIAIYDHSNDQRLKSEFETKKFLDKEIV